MYVRAISFPSSAKCYAFATLDRRRTKRLISQVMNVLGRQYVDLQKIARTLNLLPALRFFSEPPFYCPVLTPMPFAFFAYERVSGARVYAELCVRSACRRTAARTMTL